MTWRHYLQSIEVKLIVEPSDSVDYITFGDRSISLHPMKAGREMTQGELDMMEEWRRIVAEGSAQP